MLIFYRYVTLNYMPDPGQVIIIVGKLSTAYQPFFCVFFEKIPNSAQQSDLISFMPFPKFVFLDEVGCRI
jgi:hypothetical protein